MKIGIFGGSFNPPHKQHLSTVQGLLDNGLLDKVIFVPTGDSYPKPGLASCNHRYNMLKLLCKKEKRVEVSDFELQVGQVYTYQTLDHFKSIYPSDEIFYIMGMDNLNDLVNWRNYRYLLETYNFLVVRRDGFDEEALMAIHNYRGNIVVVDIETSTISSTMIRNLIENGEDVQDYVCPEVDEYIYMNDLYS